MGLRNAVNNNQFNSPLLALHQGESLGFIEHQLLPEWARDDQNYLPMQLGLRGEGEPGEETTEEYHFDSSELSRFGEAAVLRLACTAVVDEGHEIGDK